MSALHDALSKVRGRCTHHHTSHSMMLLALISGRMDINGPLLASFGHVIMLAPNLRSREQLPWKLNLCHGNRKARSCASSISSNPHPSMRLEWKDGF